MVAAEGAQLSLNGKSRVSREAQARFREGLGVKLPGATRPGTENHFHFVQVVSVKWLSDMRGVDKIRCQISFTP